MLRITKEFFDWINWNNCLQCRLLSDYASDLFSGWRQSVDEIIICTMRFAKLEVNEGN